MKILLPLSILLILVSCKEEPEYWEDTPSPCENNWYDTVSVDTMNLHIQLDCSGAVAAGLMVLAEFNHDYGEFYDSYLDTFYTDASGNLEFIWYGYCEDHPNYYNSLYLYIGDSMLVDLIGPTNSTHYYTISLADSIHLQISFHFENSYSENDTLWYGLHYGDEAFFLTGPFADTTITLPAYRINDQYFIDDYVYGFVDWGIGYEEYDYWHSIYQPGIHTVTFEHIYCNPLDLLEINVE